MGNRPPAYRCSNQLIAETANVNEQLPERKLMRFKVCRTSNDEFMFTGGPWTCRQLSTVEFDTEDNFKIW